MTSSKTYFLNTIEHLRISEEIILYTNLPYISVEQENLTIAFLEKEYANESTHYPYTPPAFNALAALWGAKTIYYASQLILYRENKGKDLPILLPAYTDEQNASAILSADLCLRFLSQILDQIKVIDLDDLIIPLLEGHLQQWHYSAIGYNLNPEMLNFGPILENNSLKQLYINRIIENKSKTLAELTHLNEYVKASMGNYSSLFWKDL
jgi:hypothetical protein